MTCGRCYACRFCATATFCRIQHFISCLQLKHQHNSVWLLKDTVNRSPYILSMMMLFSDMFRLYCLQVEDSLMSKLNILQIKLYSRKIHTLYIIPYHRDNVMVPFRNGQHTPLKMVWIGLLATCKEKPSDHKFPIKNVPKCLHSQKSLKCCTITIF